MKAALVILLLIAGTACALEGSDFSKMGAQSDSGSSHFSALTNEAKFLDALKSINPVENKSAPEAVNGTNETALAIEIIGGNASSNSTGSTNNTSAINASTGSSAIDVPATNASSDNAETANATSNETDLNGTLLNASLQNISLLNASSLNSSSLNASTLNVSLSNASLLNASSSNASLLNASSSNASLLNASSSNASLLNASSSNASLLNASSSNASAYGGSSLSESVDALAKGVSSQDKSTVKGFWSMVANKQSPMGSGVHSSTSLNGDFDVDKTVKISE